MNGLEIAQWFNREVLKGQLNPDGEALKKLAKTIDEELEQRWVDGQNNILERDNG